MEGTRAVWKSSSTALMALSVMKVLGTLTRRWSVGSSASRQQLGPSLGLVVGKRGRDGRDGREEE